MTEFHIRNHFTETTRPLLNKVTRENWVPNREDVLALLQEVQIGYLSCSRVTDILYAPIAQRKCDCS